jgi:hypothetical protein
MKTSALQKILHTSPNSFLQFVLPGGALVPIHAHITEVGRVDKTFLDCGATLRKVSTLCLQAWVADDVDHRLPAGRLVEIIERAAPILASDDLEVEVEYEDAFISQFPLESINSVGDIIVLTLGRKHTDCLAKDICLPPVKDEDSSCCSSTGCC